MGRFNFVQNQQAQRVFVLLKGETLGILTFTNLHGFTKLQDFIGTTPINLIEAEY